MRLKRILRRAGASRRRLLVTARARPPRRDSIEARALLTRVARPASDGRWVRGPGGRAGHPGHADRRPRARSARAANQRSREADLSNDDRRPDTGRDAARQRLHANGRIFLEPAARRGRAAGEFLLASRSEVDHATSVRRAGSDRHPLGRRRAAHAPTAKPRRGAPRGRTETGSLGRSPATEAAPAICCVLTSPQHSPAGREAWQSLDRGRTLAARGASRDPGRRHPALA